jgi:hypothetical protein
MSLISDISTIVTGLYPDATYLLSSKFQANVTAYLTDTTDLTLIILDNELPNQAEIKKNNNVIKDQKIIISFLSLDSTDNTDLQSEAIRAAMEAMADRVAVNIFQLLPVRPAGNQKYKTTPLFHVFSSNMTGVALEMQVNYNTIIEFCKPT